MFGRVRLCSAEVGYVRLRSTDVGCVRLRSATFCWSRLCSAVFGWGRLRLAMFEGETTWRTANSTRRWPTSRIWPEVCSWNGPVTMAKRSSSLFGLILMNSWRRLAATSVLLSTNNLTGWFSDKDASSSTCEQNRVRLSRDWTRIREVGSVQSARSDWLLT